MSLSASDTQDIRSIIESALEKQTQEVIKPILNEIQALRNDIKEIYDRFSELQPIEISNKEFDKLTLEKKLLIINSQLLKAAKQAGIQLPR